MEEGEVGGVREVENDVGGDQSLQGATETEVVGDLAEEGLAGEEGGGGYEGGQITEVKGDDVIEVIRFSKKVVRAGGVKDGEKVGTDDEREAGTCGFGLGVLAMGDDGKDQNDDAKEECSEVAGAVCHEPGGNEHFHGRKGWRDQRVPSKLLAQISSWREWRLRAVCRRERHFGQTFTRPPDFGD